MKAIVDCNNFYCSCERLFKPELEKKPVVVLSNNDGCIVSRSDEAKKLGIEMAGPYFLAKPLIEKNNVAVFSSNYNLYGDLSWRVMESLRILAGKKNVEVYSVDEAFLDLSIFPPEEIYPVAVEIKETTEQWTGIKVSIGVAPTKVLAKLANKMAKKDKKKTGCVLVLDTEEKITEALRVTAVNDIWGVGSRYAHLLKEQWGIFDALQLRNLPEEFARKHLGGVVGVRLIRELRGVESRLLEEELVTKKMIATTRMFGSPVEKIKDIKEAVATYISRAAEKLRRQFGAARIVTVFLVPRQQNPGPIQSWSGTQSAYTILPAATSSTSDMIKAAMLLVEQLFCEGRKYKKAGVMLGGIVPDSAIQSNLFQPGATNENRRLMEMIDNVNFSQRDDVLKFAASGTRRNWKMRQELRSPRYTTRWNELYEVI